MQNQQNTNKKVHQYLKLYNSISKEDRNKLELPFENFWEDMYRDDSLEEEKCEKKSPRIGHKYQIFDNNI